MSIGLRFSQMTVPPLEVGEYEIKVEQVTNLKVALASESLNITVATERFSIPGGQVYSVYPPASAVGDYSECLPHIVLKRRTLPWEMKLNNELPEMPWLMLLVLDETDLFSVVNSNCQEAIQPELNTFVPNLKLEAHEKEDSPCSFVTLPKSLFTELVPYERELCLLAHGKGVSLDYKVTDETVKDDWFATIVANRFCLMPLDETHAITHTALLVSLEGFEKSLKDSTQREEILSGCENVRMIVLSSWQFSMAKPLFDFGSVFTNLKAGMMETPYSGTNDLVQKLCNQGYMPMNHQIRDGSQTVSWYQSPFIPYAEEPVELRCAQFADQLLCYDPELSMFDLRYAAAWQQGKSMALADQGFAQKLFEWRMNNQKTVKTSKYHTLMLNHLNDNRNKVLPHHLTQQALKTELKASLEEAITEVFGNANSTGP